MTNYAPPKLLHAPGSPDWCCAECGRPWPCAEAKDELIAVAARGSDVSLFLAVCLREAITDSVTGAGPEPEELWERFLGWFTDARRERRAARRGAAG